MLLAMTGVAVVGVLQMIKDLEYGWMVWKVVMILYIYVVQSGDVRKRGIGIGDFLSESNQEIVYRSCSKKNVQPCTDLLELLFTRIMGGARHSGKTETVT